MKVAARVDYSGILAMSRELAKYSPLPYQQIAKLETASIIKIAALRARIASVTAIKRGVAAKLDSLYESPDGSVVSTNRTRDRGRVWFVPGDQANTARAQGKSFRKAQIFLMVFETGGARGWHLPDFYWAAYQLAIGDRTGALKTRVKEVLQRRGLMRLSWLQIGDSLGVPLSSVSPNGNLQEAIARAARGPNGRTYRNGTSYITTTSTQLTIKVRNVSPLAIKNKGQEQLDRAMAQRYRGFTIAMKKGMLTDLKARSARWKGVFVSG